MPEMTTISTAELTDLKVRVKKLATDKSYLQLIIRLMNKVNAVPGLDNTVETMLKNVVDVIGGTNIILYYVIDNDIYYADVYGERKKLDSVADSLVKKVMETRESIEFEHEFSDTQMITPEFSKAYTWIVPLLVGSDIVGVFKMESLNIAMRDLYQHLPTFFTYAALVLKNEILGHTRLKQAYDRIEQEMVVRHQVEEELRQANESLEERVTERTVELRNANEQLSENEKQIKSLLDKSEQSRRALLSILEDEKQAQATLRRERALLSRIMETSPVGITMVDRTGQITFANSQTEKVLDLTKDTITQRAYNAPEWRITDYDGNPFPDKELPFQRVMSTGQPVRDIQHAIVWPDGRRVLLSINGAPLLNEAGEVESAVCTIEDVTERKQAEAALQASETKYRIVADNTYDWEFWLDPQGQFLYSSPSCERVTGYPPSDFEADPTLLHRIIHPEDQARYKRHHLEALSVHSEPEQEFRVVHPDGAQRWLGHVCGPVYDESGKFLGVRGSNRDITERKQAEMALQRLNRELRAISNCNQILMRAVDEQTLLNDICSIVCDEAGYRMAWVGCAENDEAKTVRPIAWAGTEDGYLASANITWADTERGRGPSGTAIRSGESASIRDFMTDPRAAPWRENALQRGYRSSIALPLKDENAGTFGSLCIYSTEPSAFTPDEIRLLEELAGDLAFGIVVLRARAEHKRAEEALRQSEELLRVTLTNILDPVFITDNDGKLTFICPNVRDTLGYSVEEIQALGNISKIVGDGLFNPEELEMRGEIFNIERLIVDNFGRRRIFLATVKRVSIGEGTRLYALHDITERKQAEEALRESEYKLGEAARIAHVGYWDRDYAAETINLSDEACQIFGLPLQNRFLKLPEWHIHWLNLIHPEDRTRVTQVLNDALAGGPPYHVDYRVIRPSGEVRNIHSYAELTRDEFGKPLRMFGTMIDITERKQAEMALRESETRFRAVFENSVDAIGVSKAGIHVFVNPAYLTLFGYADNAELMGRPILDLIAPSHREQILENVRRRASGQPAPAAYETRGLRKDGSEFDMDIHVSTYELNGEIYTVPIIRDITERKQAEKALRESEERLRQIASSLREVIWLRDAQTRQVLYVNPAFQELTGRTCESFYENQNIVMDAVHPDDKEEVIKALAQRSESVHYDKEHRIIHLDGSVHWVSSQSFPVRNEAGEVYRWATIMEDITERKRNERELIILNHAINQSSDAVFLINEQLTFAYVNDAACRSLDYTREELLTMGPSDIDAVITYDAAENIMNQQFADGDYPRFETLHKTRDGRIFPVEISSSVVKYDGAKFSLTTVRDITERKRADAALKRSESFSRSIIENEPECVKIVGAEGILKYMNPAGLAMIEVEDLAVVAGHSVYPIVVPEHREAFIDLTKKVLRGERSNLQFEIIGLKGTRRWLDTHAVPLFDDQGNVESLLGLTRDITERKRAEEEILRLNQELEQRVVDRTAQLEAANKELEAFAYSVSHDLRAPLRHIDGFIEMLRDRMGAGLDDKSLHYMDVIADSARKMGTLIDDLLSFSRMGRNEMSKAQVDLDDLVQEVIREFKHETEGRDIQWKVSSLPVISGDRAMLRIVLVNLITNALKFTRPRETARIEIGCEKNDEGETVIFVRDNGVGFDMNYTSKLFGVFQRLHHQKDFEGTGIGLANVRRIISRHGGRTWAEGEVDRGATFYFSLPQTK